MNAVLRSRLLGMKITSSAIFTGLLLFCASTICDARAFVEPSDEALFEKSDMVVVATPTETHDTAEHLANFCDFKGQSVIGVKTRFAVSAVQKGDPRTKELTLYHYRPDKISVPNGPMFVQFEPAEKRVFRLYLIRLASGDFAPTAGQMDAALSVKRQ